MPPPNTNHWTTHPEYIDLLNYVIERTKDAKSPMNILSLTKEFKENSGAAQKVHCLMHRIESVRTKIHNFENIDTSTKVKLMFALSASVDANFLERMQKDAIVEVDDKKRITHYKSNDGSLELRGDHSRSAKCRTAQLESKGSDRSLINSYFENKNNADAIPKNEKEKEMGNFIEFITEKCHNVNTPLNILKLEIDFNKHFRIGRTFGCIHHRIRRYGREIQTLEFLDTLTKVKQLFCLSATLNSDCLKELRKDAFVEVDQLNRITKYTDKNGLLTLYGDHSRSAKAKLAGIERKKSKNTVKKHSNPGGDGNEESEKENGYSENDSDEYSSEEFGSEFDSNDKIAPLDEPNHMNSSNEVLDSDNETSIRNHSLSEMSIDDNFDFDPPTERTPRSEETKRSKRRHLDSEFSYNLANSRTSATPRSTDSSSSKPAKQKKIAIEKEQASNSSDQSTSSLRPIRRSIGRSPSPSFSTESGENMGNQDAPDAYGNPSDYHGPRIQEVDDYDYNPREDNIPESSPIDNQIEEPKPQATEKHNKNNEVQYTDEGSDTVAPEPKPEKESLSLQNSQNFTPQTNGNEFISIESHIRLLDALLPMMKTFETPTLEADELRIEKSIEKIKSIGNKEEKIRMNEIRTSLMTCLLIVEKSAKKEDVKREDTTSLKEFLLVFQSFLFSLKLKELDSFVTRTKHMIKELKDNDKKFPTRNIQLALQSIIEIIAP
ncbi:unnamed protein product [Caenorhabditis brenneri]